MVAFFVSNNVDDGVFLLSIRRFANGRNIRKES